MTALGQRRVITWSAIGLLCGCSTVYEGRYDFRDGWREGKVVAILSQNEVERERLTRCKGSMASADEIWVVVRYRRLGHSTRFAAPAFKGRFRVTETVYVNPGRVCAEALVRAGTPSS
jgi:hypothetical protein